MGTPTSGGEKICGVTEYGERGPRVRVLWTTNQELRPANCEPRTDDGRLRTGNYTLRTEDCDDEGTPAECSKH